MSEVPDDQIADLFLVVDFGPEFSGSAQRAVWVRAPSSTAEEAAEVGRAVLWEDADRPDPAYCEAVCVVPVHAGTPFWYRFDRTARLADLQCCGGVEGTEDGHSAICRVVHPDRYVDGEPAPEEMWPENEPISPCDVVNASYPIVNPGSTCPHAWGHAGPHEWAPRCAHESPESGVRCARVAGHRSAHTAWLGRLSSASWAS